MSSEIDKIVAWATILDMKETFYRGDKLHYALINKMLRDFGYYSLEKAFMNFVFKKRTFKDKHSFLAALFGEASRLSRTEVEHEAQ